jgi:hypothetical protein
MFKWRRFWRHEGGSSFESLALILSVIAVISVGAADFLHYAAKKDGVLARFAIGLQTKVAQLDGRAPNLRGDIDYTPTGTIVGLRRAPQLNPCTGAAK